MTRILAKRLSSATASSDVRLRLLPLIQDTFWAVRVMFGAAARAHDLRRTSEAVGPETMPDTGMAPEISSGIPVWQADLPFFMQSGFGRK
jgi:hypothetical protein